MAVNVEALLVEHLNDAPDLPETFMDVPRDRPDEFITVERTGGPRDTFRDLPMVAIQCWSSTRYLASDLAQRTADVIERARFHPLVARCTVSGNYNFPDPESGQPRYQIVAELVTKE